MKLNQIRVDDIIEGIRDGLLLIPVYLPVALAFAVTAKVSGLSLVETVIWSGGTFAGTAQIASTKIFVIGGGFLTIMIATSLINLRFSFASMSLVHYLRGVSQKMLPIFAFFIVTTTIGLIPIKAKKGGSIKTYWLIVGFCQYFQWVGFTLLGVWSGQLIPSGWDGIIAFAVPATFIGLAVTLMLKMPKVGIVVALTSAIFGIGLCLIIEPGLSIIVASIFGGCTGLLIEREKKKND